MGNGQAKEPDKIVTVEKEETSSKIIYLYAEICSSWGFDDKVASIKMVADVLKKEGFKTKLKVEPMDTGNGEFYLFQIINDEPKVVFSNSVEKHGSECTVAMKISPKNIAKIADSVVR